MELFLIYIVLLLHELISEQIILQYLSQIYSFPNEIKHNNHKSRNLITIFSCFTTSILILYIKKLQINNNIQNVFYGGGGLTEPYGFG